MELYVESFGSRFGCLLATVYCEICQEKTRSSFLHETSIKIYLYYKKTRIFYVIFFYSRFNSSVSGGDSSSFGLFVGLDVSFLLLFAYRTTSLSSGGNWVQLEIILKEVVSQVKFPILNLIIKF
jgi:hypothetical protein